MSAAPVAIVTGANRIPGIGYEVVKGLARKMPVGTTVILTARVPSMGLEATEALKKDGFCVVFHQLDINDASSVETLRDFVSKTYGGLDVLVNNAGLAFPLQDTTPFSSQARQTIDVNYYGTKRMLQAFQPLLRPGGRCIGISSRSGQLSEKSWSKATMDRLLTAESLDQLDAIAEEFVAAAASGKHRDEGFPGTAYGTSKALMTQLHRVFAKELPPPALVASVCPGLCRTYMATGRGTFMSNVLWLASFVVGSSAEGGADTPVWLCCEVAADDRQAFHGKFVTGRSVTPY
eukprot:gnl/TRDRNA2_/TRDRNA2_129267_c0_seq1.p1 gnl/TRDRNA2_/TRDRNA2_129267_c0~~gnl/TRDRNA2_/TRDRNA2_129267_c0_seq1.p1  ORF type:complete len:338 (+),score=43.68 gnl/TRDRNA2_/TRDRNA2_129267_c0_seq1:143-1015(+)